MGWSSSGGRLGRFTFWPQILKLANTLHSSDSISLRLTSPWRTISQCLLGLYLPSSRAFLPCYSKAWARPRGRRVWISLSFHLVHQIWPCCECEHFLGPPSSPSQSLLLHWECDCTCLSCDLPLSIFQCLGIDLQVGLDALRYPTLFQNVHTNLFQRSAAGSTVLIRLSL